MEDFIAKRIEYKTLSVTDVDKWVEFDYKVQCVHIKNVGDSTAYINFDGPATTDSYEIKPGEAVTIMAEVKTVHAICKTGYTTTLKMFGLAKEVVG